MYTVSSGCDDLSREKEGRTKKKKIKKKEKEKLGSQTRLQVRSLRTDKEVAGQVCLIFT